VSGRFINPSPSRKVFGGLGIRTLVSLLLDWFNVDLLRPSDPRARLKLAERLFVPVIRTEVDLVSTLELRFGVLTSSDCEVAMFELRVTCFGVKDPLKL